MTDKKDEDVVQLDADDTLTMIAMLMNACSQLSASISLLAGGQTADSVRLNHSAAAKLQRVGDLLVRGIVAGEQASGDADAEL